MKLTDSAETFNLGDTSFRRKTLIEDYKTLLPFLQKVNLEYPEWNTESQGEFYNEILKETNLFHRNNNEDLAKRGRTLTNALVKIGLTNEKRKLSKVAVNWLNGETLKANNIERSLGIDINNLLFVRQLLKLRIYATNGKNYFYPYRVALELVKKYRNIPQRDFLTLVHLIQPTFSNYKITSIIDDYQKVADNQEIFSEFLNKNFPDSESELTADELFSKYPIDEKKFNILFVNRKSATTQKSYYEFVIALLHFRISKTPENLEKLLNLAADDKIKKAFGFGKALFIRANSIQKFLDLNSDNDLLWKPQKQIYSQFVMSKKDDIVHEYQDMTKRTFNLTGLLDFNNGLVNATNQKIFSIVFTNNMELSGVENYLDYEQNLKFPFYQEETITQILKLDESSILSTLQELLGVSNPTQLENAVADQKEHKFRKFVYATFPRDKVLKILSLFPERKDSEIQKCVSEAASVPTIYEYMIGIAWMYISSKDFYITKSLNLTLDGNMRPLSHAPGGEGDIVINYASLTLMLEVTLMNRQAQKRGEWEPVLRHATNLTVDEYPKNVITLFIADELDDNTVNIWRAVASVPLKSSNKNEIVDLVKIFPLKNQEIIYLLEKKIDERNLLKAIDESYEEFSGKFDLSWRDEIFDGMINQGVNKN